MTTQGYLRAAVFGLGLMAGHQAHADASSNELVRDMVLNGCFPALATGAPVAFYAQTTQLQPANANLAAAFLRGRAGDAYMKVTPTTVIIIAQAGNAYCTVATRMASDMPALRQTIEDALTTYATPFTMVKEDTRPMDNGVVSVTREYDGAIGNVPLGVAFSTAENGPPPQAVVTVFRKAK
jgi:hypothetical protein